MKLIRFANVIINQQGDILVAVSDHNLEPGLKIELVLSANRSFELYQDEKLIGHVEETPDDAMVALATSRRVLLVEVGESGPSRIHEQVTVRAAD